MYTQTFLNQIEKAIFQPYFTKGILALQADRIEAGEYYAQVRDYQKGLASILPTFTVEEKPKFEEFESICRTIQEQYAFHGFVAGIYAGFRHIFTPHKEMDGGYNKYVMDELMSAKNMPRNQTLHHAVLARKEIYDILAEGRVKNSRSPLVSIACYWDEMACSAGSLAFYIGYRAAHSITDRFGLMETDYAAKIAKLLMLEHSFGYIETVAERDRRLERQANGSCYGNHDNLSEEDEDDEEEAECKTV